MDYGQDRKEVVDSHSSALTNARVIMNMIEIDKARLVAARSKDFEAINFYFEALDGLRLCFLRIFPNYEDIEKSKKEYEILYYNILLYDSQKTYRNILTLFMLAKLYNERISVGLNLLGYQFRTSKEEYKGLRDSDMFAGHSIFRNKRKRTERQGLENEQNKSSLADI